MNPSKITFVRSRGHCCGLVSSCLSSEAATVIVLTKDVLKNSEELTGKHLC